MQTETEFTIELHDITFWVTGHELQGMQVYHIRFSDDRPPLVIYEALGGKKTFWTSVPEGRQVEAEFFGARIAAYLTTR
ncbi:hypothetical protein SAMN05192574_105246 [Mucilaginibacter gossypiicola]|uniref:Uncharacterized protein n=1 Tax=Mucilaginibacter gossypiicola TaxID=551995 RepID=A0A1H8LTX1_9SPHI|nr:hypothetical protein [Mucilaginibacter gossypiicola]SEO08500.1 hypothetical protein SAMN05192574_105246 [Mucilaginibacter gossypiicola]